MPKYLLNRSQSSSISDIKITQILRPPAKRFFGASKLPSRAPKWPYSAFRIYAAKWVPVCCPLSRAGASFRRLGSLSLARDTPRASLMWFWCNRDRFWRYFDGFLSRFATYFAPKIKFVWLGCFLFPLISLASLLFVPTHLVHVLCSLFVDPSLLCLVLRTNPSAQHVDPYLVSKRTRNSNNLQEQGKQ